MANPEEFMLKDLDARYASVDVDPAFAQLYTAPGSFGRMFATLHKRLNAHFEFMNAKARTNRHFNADDSRQLINLIDELRDVQKLLKAVGMEFTVCDEYRKVLETCEQFLGASGGSTIPDDFSRIELIKYEPVFRLPETEITISKRRESYPLKMVGEGAFAIVSKYIDPEYGIPIAVKRARKDIDPKELIRFRKEFDLLKGLRFPNVLEVYRYNETRNEYTMEYCDSTLDDYIARNNNKLSFNTRKRIALQFLYGMNYLHSKDHLHRDVSYRNVLMKQYDGAAVMVKLSDFGLYKESGSQLTRTESELRGTILDPTIGSFKEYNLSNEIYSVGFLLSFIFSGRKHITACSGAVRPIIDKCVVYNQADRYRDVLSIIRDVEPLEAGTQDANSGSPA